MNETHYRMDLLKAMNQNLSARDRMYRMILEMTDGAFLFLESGKNEVVTIGKWEDFFDFEIHSKRDLEKIYEFVDEPYCLPLRELILLEKSNKEELSLECLTRKKNAWYRFQAMACFDDNGNLTEKIIGVFNVTKFRRQAEELDYYEFYDVITGLYNRNYFVRMLSEFLQKAEKHRKSVAVMMLDIDDFHKINDGLGMVYGDEMIRQFGDLLKNLCDENVIACHMNSDVYCIGVYDPVDYRSVDQIHERITKRLSEPFVLSGNQVINLTVTIGVAEYPDAATSALDLINCAEIVVIKGKAMGHDSFVRFDKPILKEFMLNLELESKLKEALNHQRFELYYQPQYYCGNRRLRGMEALIRWYEGGKEVINPSTFIPIAEKNGDIIPIGNWVVEESIKQYAKWRALYQCTFMLSINISARQFNQEEFVPNLLKLLSDNSVDPYFIELEITESVLIEDFEPVRDKMKKLQDVGIRISLDDFGTGFSSLSYLKKLPINTLKIDKSFIDTILTDSATRIITESIINMVKSLGFESVAEGVEQEQQYKYLHAIGCDVIQGFYLGEPLPVDEVEKLLRKLTVR